MVDAVPAGQLEAEVSRLAGSMATLDPELLATNKRIVNLALEVAGAGVMQRLAAEMDARAHLAQVKKDFDRDVKELGFKGAVQKRDGPFGDGVVRPSW